MEEDPDVGIVLKEFSILGDGSPLALRAAIATAIQGKYLKFHKSLCFRAGQIKEKKVFILAESYGLDKKELLTAEKVLSSFQLETAVACNT